jgi:hypothetical protein
MLGIELTESMYGGTAVVLDFLIVRVVLCFGKFGGM